MNAAKSHKSSTKIATAGQERESTGNCDRANSEGSLKSDSFFLRDPFLTVYSLLSTILDKILRFPPNVGNTLSRWSVGEVNDFLAPPM